MTVEANKAIVCRQAEEGFGRGDVAVCDELLAPGYVHNVRMPGITPDREGRKRLISLIHTAFPDIAVTLDDVVGEGDRVAVRWTGRASHTGEYMGIAPTGREVNWTGMSFHRVEGGKIVESWDLVDNQALMQQLGVMPQSGGER